MKKALIWLALIGVLATSCQPSPSTSGAPPLPASPTATLPPASVRTEVVGGIGTEPGGDFIIETPLPVPTYTPRPTPVNPIATERDPMAVFREGLVSTERGTLQELQGASLYYISFLLAEDLTTVSGTQEVIYTNREGATLGELEFRLFPNVLGGQMDIASILVEGISVQSSCQYQNSLLCVPLPVPLSPGQSVSIKIDFSVRVPLEPDSNYGILAYYNDVLTLAHAYPMVAVYDDEGWNVEIPPDQGDPTYADASFYLVQVDAPAALVLVASGRQVSRQVDGGRQQVTFAAGPARDFYLAASPKYKVISKKVGEITFNSFAPESMLSGAQMALDVAIRSFEVFEERYAPYPYTEFDIVATPTYALGVEYPGIVAITERIYDLTSSLNGTPNTIYMESTVAHEAGHQWFYNLVGNDQLDEPWLDESLTQYVTWQYYLDEYGQSGGSTFERSLRTRWERVDTQRIPVGMPVASYEGVEYGAIVYGRGAFFFAALRDEMDGNAFDEFLKEYTESYSWGIATGEGLKTLAEEYCDCDLTPLYEDWIYSN